MEFLKNVNKKTKVFLVLNLLFWLFYIILQIWITVTYRKSLPIALNFFDFIVLIAYFLINQLKEMLKNIPIKPMLVWTLAFLFGKIISLILVIFLFTIITTKLYLKSIDIMNKILYNEKRGVS